MNTKERMIQSFLRDIEGWKSVLDSSPDLIAILDTEFNFVWINKAMANYMHKSQDSCLGLKCFEVVHGIESPIPNCPHAKMIRDSNECTEEVTEENLGGCFFITASPIKDESGNILGSIHIARDIPERKKAEEDIKRLANVVESSDDAILTKSLDGIIIGWNKGAEEIYGYLSAEILGKHISILEPPQLREETERLINKIKSGERIHHYDTLRLRKDSRLINVSVTLSPVFNGDGELVAISTIARDITQQKNVEKQKQELLERTQKFAEELEVSNEELRTTTEELQVSNEELQATTEELQVSNEELQATTEELQVSNEELQATAGELQVSNEELQATTEELQVSNEELRQQENELIQTNNALKESEERFRSLADNIPNLAWMADAEGWIFWYNKQWYDYTGTTLEEMQGWGWQKVHHPDYVGPVTEEWSTHIKEGKFYDNIFPLRGSDGNYKWFLTRVTPIKDGNGKIQRWFGTNTDITERKEAEKAILWNQKRNEILAEVSNRLLTSENPQDIIEDLCYKIMEFLECDVFFNYLVDEEKGCLHLNAYSGIPEEEAKRIEWLDYGVAVCGCAALESRRIISENILETPDPRTDLVKGYGVQAYACHPLLVEGLSIGTLSFGVNSRAYFTEEELDLMKAVADQIAIAMDRLLSNLALKKSEEAAVGAKNEWEHTFGAVPDLIAILSTDYKIVRANKSMADKFGITPEECIGLTCYEVVHGTKKPPSFCPHHQLLSDGFEHTEEVHEDNLGGDFLVSASPLHDFEGKLIGSVHVARDINERKRREKELYGLNKAYMALSNSSQAMIRAKDELEYLEDVCRIIVEDCGHSMVWVGYADEDEAKTVRPVAYSGFEEGYLETLNITWADTEHGRGPTGTAIRTGKPSACKNMGVDPKFIPWRENAIERGYASSLVLPLKIYGRVFGALTIYSTELDSFSDDKVKLLTELAENLAYGINVIRLRISREQAEAELEKTLDNLEIQVKERTLELKEAYESLKFANNYNRSLIEANLDPLVTIGSDGKITDVNYSTEQVTGCSRDDIIGTDFSDYFTEPEKARAGYQEAFREGWVFDYPLEIKHMDGRITPVLYNASVYRDESGKVMGVFAAARNITEIKQAENEIKRQAELLNLTHEAIIVRDMDNKILFWNGGAVKIYGWNMEEAKGKIIYSLLQTKFPVSLNDLNKELISKGRWDGELAHTKRDGTRITVLSRQVLKKDEKGNPVSILEINSDISKRKKMEEELEFAGKYNRNLIETSLDPFVTIGPDGKITDVNGATEAVTGYARDELIGTDFSDYFTEPEKAREGYKRVFKESWIIDYPLEIKHKEGHVTPVLYNASIYEDESGNVIGVFAAARDITERKQAETKLKEIIEELERSNYELQQFAYITSHDLQEPLRTIASYTQLIERRYKNKLDDDADDFLDFIVEAAVRMKDMIQGLLYYSRVGTKGGELRPISTEELLEIALSNLKAAIEENNVTTTHDELPVVVADRGQLIQLFQNLISNGIKFKRENETPKIHISAQKGENEHIFSVADNGIGIEPQYFNKIFEVFKRLHTSVEYEGTGIGLSISKRIIERHGGRMWVESEGDNGSVFYFTIPFAQ